VARDQFAEGKLVLSAHVEKFDADSMSTFSQRAVADKSVQHDAVRLTWRAQLDHNRTHGVGHFVDKDQPRSARRNVDEATPEPQGWALDAILGVEVNGLAFRKRTRSYGACCRSDGRFVRPRDVHLVVSARD
jgi:hypothetical protein